jgi:hypothetical protein
MTTEFPSTINASDRKNMKDLIYVEKGVSLSSLGSKHKNKLSASGKEILLGSFRNSDKKREKE